MPLTIVFDTNYLRALSAQPYLAGALPDVLGGQIDKAFARGDLIAMVTTVHMEMNAWLHGMFSKREEEIQRAEKTLQDAGYTLTHPGARSQRPPDIYDAFVARNQKCALLNPSLEDYSEAERRTSFRLPPLPPQADGEELRDRLIWCQLLRYSDGGKRPVLIVSNDQLFTNGATSEEGVAAKIEFVRTVADLDQRLGERPAHITNVVDVLLTMVPVLAEHGVTLSSDNVKAIENLRNVEQAGGSLERRFTLITSGAGIPEAVPAILITRANGAGSLRLVGDREIYVETPATTQEPLHSSRTVNSGIEQLRRLTRGSI